jgi:hypothetical protein
MQVVWRKSKSFAAISGFPGKRPSTSWGGLAAAGAVSGTVLSLELGPALAKVYGQTGPRCFGLDAFVTLSFRKQTLHLDV